MPLYKIVNDLQDLTLQYTDELYYARLIVDLRSETIAKLPIDEREGWKYDLLVGDLHKAVDHVEELLALTAAVGNLLIKLQERETKDYWY